MPRSPRSTRNPRRTASPLSSERTPDVRSLIARLDALASTAREHAEEADRQARLSSPVVDTLVRAQLFRLWIPRRYGGLELSLPETLQVYEAAAAIDGSVGWAVMIGSGGGLFAACLDPETAAEIYSPPDAVIAGSGAPDGRAERVAEGGYRVTGRWRYASGADYATTFTANCVVAENGGSIVRAMAFEPSQVKITPTWDTTGMRGTGSHDFSVTDAVVPARRSFDVFGAPLEPGPLYRLPFMVLTQLPVAAVGLGIARHALEAFAALIRNKKGKGAEVSLSGEAVVQAQFAQSHARWRAARALIHELAREAWDAAVSQRELGAAELAEISAGSTLCVSDLRQSVAQLSAFAGMSAILTGNELSRAARDLQTLSAHTSVSPRNFPAAGAALL